MPTTKRLYTSTRTTSSTWSGLEVYDITKANRVYHYQVTHKKYGVTTNIDSFLSSLIR